MNVDEVWREIDAYRLNLIEVLSGLSGEDWRQPSLCAGWTAREVLAHLTYQHIAPGTAGPDAGEFTAALTGQRV